jgi:ketosteroid isomerase-like protein
MLMDLDPQQYAEQWIAEWNARDLDAVLAHYADDVVFRSPVAARVRPDSGGIITGKAALEDYWRAALALVADLHFELEAVYPSVDALTICYRNQRGQQVAESLVLGEDGLVQFGMGAYGPDPAAA